MRVIKTISGAHALVDVGCRERRKAELPYTSLSHGVGNRSDVRFRRPLKRAVLSSRLHLDRLGKDGPAQGIFQPEPRALRGALHRVDMGRGVTCDPRPACHIAATTPIHARGQNKYGGSLSLR